MHGVRCFFSWEKQVFLISFSLIFPRFPCRSKNRLNNGLACWMWCNNLSLYKRRNLYIWLLNVMLLLLYLLDPWQYPEGSYEIWSVHRSSRKDPMKYGLSIIPSCHLYGRFLRIGLLDFSEFWNRTGKPYGVVHDSPIVWKNFFLSQKLGKWAKNSFFFNLKKNLVINFHWMYSIINFFIICCVPRQRQCS